ncbi:ubiquitin-related modifier 1 [Usnea florida]
MEAKSNDEGEVPLTIEFTGGLELLFSNQRKHQIAIPRTDENGGSANLAFLVRYLCKNVMADKRKEIRPGILVLVNDADWELEGEDQYELKRNDNILFVSTLHGG